MVLGPIPFPSSLPSRLYRLQKILTKQGEPSGSNREMRNELRREWDD